MMTYYFVLFLAASAIFRSMEQISNNRFDRTWLPKWLISRGGRINIDGYHIVSALHYWSMFFAGIFYFMSGFSLWWIALLWLVYGNIFSLFYHVIFMKPEFRENFFLDWLKELLGKTT